MRMLDSLQPTSVRVTRRASQSVHNCCDVASAILCFVFLASRTSCQQCLLWHSGQCSSRDPDIPWEGSAESGVGKCWRESVVRPHPRAGGMLMYREGKNYAHCHTTQPLQPPIHA